MEAKKKFHKFLIELVDILYRYDAEIYKSSINGDMSVEVTETGEYGYKEGFKFNVKDCKTLTLKNIKNYLKEQSRTESIPFDDFITLKAWVARNRDGLLRMYANKPFKGIFDKMFGDWSGAPISVIDSRYFPDLTYSDEPIEVVLAVSDLVAK